MGIRISVTAAKGQKSFSLLNKMQKTKIPSAKSDFNLKQVYRFQPFHSARGTE